MRFYHMSPFSQRHYFGVIYLTPYRLFDMILLPQSAMKALRNSTKRIYLDANPVFVCNGNVIAGCGDPTKTGFMLSNGGHHTMSEKQTLVHPTLQKSPSVESPTLIQINEQHISPHATREHANKLMEMLQVRGWNVVYSDEREPVWTFISIEQFWVFEQDFQTAKSFLLPDFIWRVRFPRECRCESPGLIDDPVAITSFLDFESPSLRREGCRSRHAGN